MGHAEVVVGGLDTMDKTSMVRSAHSSMVVAAPYSPADYKAAALECAYLTPRSPSPAILHVSTTGAAEAAMENEEGRRPARFKFQPDAKEADPLLTVKQNTASISPRLVYSAPYQLFIGLLLASSVIFLFADQNLLAPNLTAVARDFGFDDAQRDIKLGGQIPFAFFVVGGLVSVVVGPLSDVLNRKNLYVWTCLIGTIPTLLTYWVQTFPQFFILRTLTGVAVGGAFPLIYSLASDMTEPHQRAVASSAITISMGMGSTLGQAVAGFIGPLYGWRVPFVVIALPNIFVTALVVLLIDEPERHSAVVYKTTARGAQNAGMTGYHRSETNELKASFARTGCSMQMRKFLDVFIIRTNLLAFCQSIPGCLPWGVISAFLTDFLHEQRGMTVQGATGLMFIFGMGCFAGNLLGGLLGQWVYNRSKEWAAYVMAASTLVGAAPMYWIINSPTTISTPSGGFTPLAGVVAFVGGIAAFTGPLVRAFVMQVNSSRNRGTVFSVFMVADDLGKGMGPAVVSLLIPAMGRVVAFNLSLGGWFFCALFLFLMAFTIRADEEEVARQTQAEKVMKASTVRGNDNTPHLVNSHAAHAMLSARKNSKIETIDI